MGVSGLEEVSGESIPVLRREDPTGVAQAEVRPAPGPSAFPGSVCPSRPLVWVDPWDSSGRHCSIPLPLWQEQAWFPRSPAWPGAVTHSAEGGWGFLLLRGAGPLQGHSPRDRVAMGLLPTPRWGGFLALLAALPVSSTPLPFPMPSCGHRTVLLGCISQMCPRPQGLGL